MTRINLVPPAELCDQHLLAEHRELTRMHADQGAVYVAPVRRSRQLRHSWLFPAMEAPPSL